jgi:branched-subunit amino acid aminotransferase/4-amino-4-deoxychorismate lyase
MPRRQRGKKSDSVLFKSAEWIGWALGGLEREIEETRERLKMLTDQAAALRSRVGVAARRGVAAAVAAHAAGKPAGPTRRGRMSAEGRRRMSEMMKKRWQEAKKKNRNRL